MKSIGSLHVSVASIMMAVCVMHTVSALPAFPIVASNSKPQSRNNEFPALNTSFTANLTDSNDNNIIFVAECGEEKVNVQRAYGLARAAVLAAKADVARGSHSPFGFSAMFKNDQSKYPVSDYLNMIYYSQGLRNLRPDPAHLTSPRLACVQRNSASVFRNLRLGYDPWERCNGRSSRQRYPHRVFYASRTAYIFLCPDFHDQAPAPASNHCPTVMDNKFAGDANVFYRDYQMYSLLYGLIRFYLQQNALSSRSVPNEVFDWNQCVGSTPETSMKNPTNFLLYMALAQQQCLAAPNPFKPPFTPFTPPSVADSVADA